MRTEHMQMAALGASLVGGQPDVASGLTNPASLLHDRGELAAAEVPYPQGLEMRRRLVPGDHADVANSLNNLGLLLKQRGDSEAAETLYRQSLAMHRSLFPGDHPSVANSLNSLAGVLLGRADFAGAHLLLQECAAMYGRVNGPNDSLTGNARLRLGRARLGLDRFAEAEAELVDAERVLSTAQGTPRVAHRKCLEGLVLLYESWNAAEPGNRHDAKVAEWKARLDAASATPGGT